MSWVFNQLKNESFRSHPILVQYILGSPPSSPPPPYDQSIENKISPSILLIIIILAVMFFISGLLHLLVRLLIRPPRRDLDDLDNATVLQGQLQQLFHLHDSGVDQSYIDTLPVFLYKSIIGAKNPFDCAVCLCELEPDDRLRLLPNCSHAFHLECIDTWLLSHSTCPLCRGSLLPDFMSSNYSPVVLVLESGSESSREMVQRDFGESLPAAHINLEDGFLSENPQKLLPDVAAMEEPKVVSVKLGKLKMTGGGGSDSGGGCDGGARIGSVRIGGQNANGISNVDSRRCYSMGSFEYVLDESSLLKVPIVSMKKKQSMRKQSMCDLSKISHSRGDGFKTTEQNQPGSSRSPVIQESKTESFSMSKIWLRSKKDKPSFFSGDSSRRAFSFRLPLQRVDELKPQGGRNVPEIVELEDYGHGDCSLPRSSECGTDQLNSGRHSLDSLRNRTPSFATKTINWIVGRQNRVTHSAPLAPV